MNSYKLSAESRHWWMPSAAAGLAAASAIAMIALAPASGYAASEPRDRGPAVVVPASDSIQYRPCHMIRPHADQAPEGPAVRCVLRAR